MPDWKSTAELQLEGGIFAKFMHALLGLYVYVRVFFSALGFLSQLLLIPQIRILPYLGL